MTFWSVLLCALLSFFSSNPCLPELHPVQELDLSRYQGLWYEIGTSRTIYDTIQRNCVCTHHQYILQEDPQSWDFLQIHDTCVLFSPSSDQEWNLIGRADVRDPNKPGELTVTYLGLPAIVSPNYIVLALGPDPDYGYALIGDPKLLYLWILARDPHTFDQATYDHLLQIAHDNGYDLDAIGFKKTLQEGCA